MITVKTVGPSTYVDTAGAVDADIVAWGCPYGVTLTIDPVSGDLDRWGELDHWLHGREMRGLTRDQLDDIVTAVRDAAA